VPTALFSKDVYKRSFVKQVTSSLLKIILLVYHIDRHKTTKERRKKKAEHDWNFTRHSLFYLFLQNSAKYTDQYDKYIGHFFIVYTEEEEKKQERKARL